ncbi:MAG: polyprenyl diphosphate synthase [Chloroflexaceae bacterium]
MQPMVQRINPPTHEKSTRTLARRQCSDRIIPRHIAFIMDGNGRWATMRGLQRSVGHKYGREHILTVAEMCYDLGVQVISCFAWSTENWNRPPAEVDYIMRSTEKHLLRFVHQLHAKKIRFMHTGSRHELPESVLRVIDAAVELTRSHTERVFNLVLNYSGRTELLEVARQMLAQPLTAEEISETTISARLWTAGLPDVDLLFRSSGEQRISNYMLWQSAHAHLHVCNTYWPMITKQDIEQGIESYNRNLGQE